MAVPVHNHSEYSALDGYSHPKEIADRIEAVGAPGAFLTDHGTVAGLQTFKEHMTWRDPRKKTGKRDLFVGYGMEAYQAKTSRKLTKDTDGKAFKKGQDSYHLILLASSPEGYRNLLRISDDANRTGFYYDPRVDWELLNKYHEGLICTTACVGSLPCQELVQNGNTEPIWKLHEIFGDDFYIELSTYDTEDQRVLNNDLLGIAQDRGIGVIYANDAHYAEPDAYDYHEALLCAQYAEYLLDPKKYSNAEDKTMHHPHCLYIMGEDEVRERLDHLPEWAVDEALGNTDLLMEQCSFELEKPGLYLPKFKVPEEYADSADMLESLVIEGLEERYELTDEVLDRAEMEFAAIVDAGLQDYFLIVWDFINYALRHGVMVGPGRGSVGGSIMADALGITSINPIKYGLQFERFWNPGRADGLPDIDCDFEQSARQFMIEYVKRKYGEDRVLPIGNHIFMRPKSAIDKAGMVLYKNPPYGVMTLIKKEIETTTDAGAAKPWDEMWEALQEEADLAGKDHPLDEYKRKHPELFELAEALSGRISTYGVHASAVVISEVDLQDHLPARMAADDDKRKVLVTQAEMKQVEKAGFPKFDFLGLRNLDTIVMTAILSGEFGDAEVLAPKFMKVIEERAQGGVKSLDKDLRTSLLAIGKHFRQDTNFNHLPDSAWALIDNGHTLGLFQIEDSSSPRRIGRSIRPRSIEDLAAIVALNRPGPLRGGVVDRFLARRKGEEETVFPHPILEEILAPTYGDFLYQEQVIAYFRAIGYSLSDADHIRKILGKKLVSEMVQEYPHYVAFAAGEIIEWFCNDCFAIFDKHKDQCPECGNEHITHTEMSESDLLKGLTWDDIYGDMNMETARRIWRLIVDFSKYSFNKAHSVGYGMITAWTMYAKWKWPVEFIMASITTMSGQARAKKMPLWINEATRMEVEVFPPDVNRSDATIRKDGDSILYGLRDIKGIGEDAAAWIVEHAPYESPEDFVRKCVDPENKATVNGKKIIVVKANHRDALMNAGAFDSFDYRLAKCTRCDGKGRVRIDPTKRILDDCPDCEAIGFAKADLPDDRTKSALEEEYLGVSLTNLNVEIIAEHREELDALDPITSAESEEETTVKVPGVVSNVQMLTATWPLKPNQKPDWARVTINWEGEEVTFAAFPDAFSRNKYILTPNTVGVFTLKTSKKGAQLKKGKKLVV